MSSDAPRQLSSAGQKFYNAIRKMDEDWDEVQEKIDVHNADIEDINDRRIAEINAQTIEAEEEQSQLQSELNNRSLDDFEQNARDLEDRVMHQSQVNLDTLEEINQLQERKGHLANEEFELQDRLNTATYELEDVQDRIDRTKVSMRREQEQLAESADSRQEEMRALEAEMAQFKEKSSLVKNRRKVLADLREKNKGLEDLVEVVKDSVLDTFGGEGSNDKVASPKAFLEGRPEPSPEDYRRNTRKRPVTHQSHDRRVRFNDGC